MNATPTALKAVTEPEGLIAVRPPKGFDSLLMTVMSKCFTTATVSPRRRQAQDKGLARMYAHQDADSYLNRLILLTRTQVK